LIHFYKRFIKMESDENAAEFPTSHIKCCRDIEPV